MGGDIYVPYTVTGDLDIDKISTVKQTQIPNPNQPLFSAGSYLDDKQCKSIEWLYENYMDGKGGILSGTQSLWWYQKVYLGFLSKLIEQGFRFSHLIVTHCTDEIENWMALTKRVCPALCHLKVSGIIQ